MFNNTPPVYELAVARDCEVFIIARGTGNFSRLSQLILSLLPGSEDQHRFLCSSHDGERGTAKDHLP